MTEPLPSDIVVAGYTPRYLAAFGALIGTEGGFVDDQADRGGATNHGVSLRFLKAAGAFDEDGDGFAEFDLDMDGDIDGQDIRKLTLADAKAVYVKFFWNPTGAEAMPQPIGEMVFDQAVNGGLVSARKLLQRALNTCLADVTNDPARPPLLTIDGQLGSVSWRALGYVCNRGVTMLAIAYRHAAEDRYRAIAAANPSQIRFLNGWVTRAKELGAWAR